MIYLLGVSHDMQWNRSLVLTQEFIKFVNGLIIDKRIELIADEWNIDAINLSDNPKTTISEMAEMNNIDHIEFDPNIEERKKMGIPDREEIRNMLCIPRIMSSKEFNIVKEKESEYNHLREKYWINKLKRNLHKNILIVCGSDHITKHNPKGKNGFDKLLAKINPDVEIIDITFVTPDVFNG